MIYLELDDLLAIASEVLGLEVDVLLRVTDLGLADSAVSRPQASFAGEEFYATIEAKAATLLFGIAGNHAFIDGNKRVAVLATLQFLNVNGLDLNLSRPRRLTRSSLASPPAPSRSRSSHRGSPPDWGRCRMSEPQQLQFEAPASTCTRARRSSGCSTSWSDQTVTTWLVQQDSTSIAGHATRSGHGPPSSRSPSINTSSQACKPTQPPYSPTSSPESSRPR